MSNKSPLPPTDRLVIGFAGRIGAGKTSAAKYLNSEYDFQYIRYSQVLSDWLASDPQSKVRLQQIGWEVMAGGMQPELDRRLIAQIRPDTDAAVDGLRHPLDRQSLLDSYDGAFRLVYIECSSDVRWQHVKGRTKHAELTAFQASDSHPVEQRIEKLRGGANRVLKNEGSLEDLYAEIGKAVREFRRGAV
jgi:dephospho-CoA kinase